MRSAWCGALFLESTVLTSIPLDSVFKLLSIVVLSAIVLINLKLAKSAQNHPAGAVWRDHPRLMWSSMAFLSLLVVLTALDLASRFGLLGADALAVAMPYVGVPAGFAALWVIVEFVRLGYGYFTGRR